MYHRTYIPYSGKLLREKTFADHFRGMLNHSFVSIGGCGMHKISWRKFLLWVALKLQNSSPSIVPAIYIVLWDKGITRCTIGPVLHRMGA